MKIAISLLGLSGLAFVYWAIQHQKRPEDSNEYSQEPVLWIFFLAPVLPLRQEELVF